MKRVHRGLLLVVCAVTLGSCTYVPTDSQPQVVNLRNVPFNLLNRHPVPAPPTTRPVTTR